eukprot:COSAG01_NODE_202_length_22130_cov_167.927239_12_plen_98_part_00
MRGLAAAESPRPAIGRASPAPAAAAAEAAAGATPERGGMNRLARARQQAAARLNQMADGAEAPIQTVYSLHGSTPLGEPQQLAAHVMRYRSGVTRYY